MEKPPAGRDDDPDRLAQSLEELEELVDQVILYADPRYLDEGKLETPEGAAFARQCREVAEYLKSLSGRLEGLQEAKRPEVPDDLSGLEGL